jgi:predicted ATPase
MITRLKVDGFRSLSHFDMTINPGLNILVGPNGSGKTNIVSFLQFLAYMATYPLADAVTKAGGAGSVFQKIRNREYRKGLTALIEGVYTNEQDEQDRPVAPRRRQTATSSVRYIYTFELSASPELDVVVYQAQELRAWISSGRRPPSNSGNPDFQINIDTKNDAEPVLTIPYFEFAKFEININSGRQGPNKTRFEEMMTHFILIRGDSDENLIRRLGAFISDLQNLSADFTGGEIFNIIPSQVKLPEDSAKAPFIQSDGSGLAPTLYALQKNTRRWPSAGLFRRVHRELPAGAFQQIIKYLRTVNETIISVNVVNDPFDNRLKIVVVIFGEEGEVELPFSSMSDGTVKWASLITAILTYESIFAIEEPENFLHPLMQKEILNIMRENVQRRGGQSFVIMTTHSETLLNAADPTEVVVVSIFNGITRTERATDPESLRKQIQRTGFGLGYFYISGALENA